MLLTPIVLVVEAMNPGNPKNLQRYAGVDRVVAFNEQHDVRAIFDVHERFLKLKVGSKVNLALNFDFFAECLYFDTAEKEEEKHEKQTEKQKEKQTEKYNGRGVVVNVLEADGRKEIVMSFGGLALSVNAPNQLFLAACHPDEAVRMVLF
jgi:hypothetical protein